MNDIVWDRSRTKDTCYLDTRTRININEQWASGYLIRTCWVIRIVCSFCADRPWSTVTAVHLSRQMSTSPEPWLMMGSIVKIMPGCIKCGDLLRTWWIWGARWNSFPMPWPMKLKGSRIQLKRLKHTYLYICMHVQICMYVCMHACTSVFMYVCMHVCYVCMYY